eukprot:TRINITY_DN4605_c0_g1_i1.p1 TRINITY_DN4605_c0_g1~~TRINITY_DN4605_c0_g1_i1.p1  ORF type:complete len:241 (-),score=93.65 TRINITY_DN4605_c0_g1_i1:147-869(-)
MYNGIGITTPRGTGTSGHVQKNLAHINKNRIKPPIIQERKSQPIQKKANEEILEHERKRQLEVQVFDWAKKNGFLDREDLGEEELEELLQKKREQLTKDQRHKSTPNPNLQETHQRSAQKEKETERFRNALGVSKDYKSGDAFNVELQEKKREESRQRRIAIELEKMEKEEKRKEVEREEKKRRIRDEERRDPEEEDGKRMRLSPKRSKSRSPSSQSSSSPSSQSSSPQSSPSVHRNRDS